MQLRLEQLSAHLDRPLSPLYLLHGDEPFLVIQAADAIRQAARRQGFTQREVIVAGNHFRWDDLFLAAGNLSLFGETKLIDLRIPSGKPGREGSEALQRYIKTINAETVTLITLPELDWQARKATWVTALSQAGVAIECNAPPLARLPQWLAERLARQKQSASPEGLAFLATHVEGNLLAAHQEIQKLGLIYPAGKIALADIETAVLNVARYDISDLRDALKARDTVRAVRTLEGLEAEGAAPPLVLWALATEARTAKNRPALMQAAKIDRLIKGLVTGNLWDEFLQLALRLTRPATRPGPGTSARMAIKPAH
jgi:DNA polymerase-3 subunit delta